MFAKACNAAKNDETIRLIVKSIIASNRSGKPDQTAYKALRDRVQEVGIMLPNDGYFSMLFASVARHVA